MIQKIDYDDPINHIETGAVQFGDDWPGLFIRGDDAMELLLLLERIKSGFMLFEMNKMTLDKYAQIIKNEVIVK